MAVEKPLCFRCEGAWLYGIAHLPDAPGRRGVLIVVGGPQYRVGSHRQFLLLARHLAGSGIPTLRFDYRGMGDSDGEVCSFEQVDLDIRAALNELFSLVPDLKEIVIWGLCDAASAALFYAHRDPRVVGLALLNPWVRTEAGIAKAYLKNYYSARLFDPNLWRKIIRGEFDFLLAMRSFLGMAAAGLNVAQAAGAPGCTVKQGGGSLPDRMLDGLQRYQGKVLLILSGQDLTAQEFKGLISGSPQWRKQLASPRLTRHELAEANHTFSRREWRDQVAKWTAEWVQQM
ncbi:MAG: hydrolase 1, exosortase A system-associated [Gammaproteobacteria bacterium]